MLERNLGVRLFQRSTRRMKLTEAGERSFGISAKRWSSCRAPSRRPGTRQGEPAGTLRVSLAPGFWRDLCPAASAATSLPAIRPSGSDWQFDNRQVDLIADSFDAAIGGGFRAHSRHRRPRRLRRAHIIAVAAPSLLEGRARCRESRRSRRLAGIAMRSTRPAACAIGRCAMRQATRSAVALHAALCFDDPAAMVAAALLGLGVTLVSVPDALPQLESGALVRVVARLVCRCRGALALLLGPQPAAGQDPCVHRFRGRCLQAATACRAIFRQLRLVISPAEIRSDPRIHDLVELSRLSRSLAIVCWTLAKSSPRPVASISWAALAST